MQRSISLALALACAVPLRLHAQEIAFGVSPHIGTVGLGADVGISVHPRVTFRAAANVFPMNFDVTSTGTPFTIDLPSPQFMLLVDLFAAGSLRLTGGALISTPDIEATAEISGTVDVGGTSYTATDVGNLTGAIVHNDIAPYIGIGVGNVARGRFGLTLDLGVAFHGEPAVTLTADGPIAQTPGFNTDLTAEVADFEDEISFFKIYPVIQAGFSIGFSTP